MWGRPLLHKGLLPHSPPPKTLIVWFQYRVRNVVLRGEGSRNSAHQTSQHFKGNLLQRRQTPSGISPARMHNNQNHPLCRRFWVTKNDSPGENSGAVLSRGLTLHNQARQRAEGAMTRGRAGRCQGGKPDIGSVAIFGRDGGHDGRSRSKQRRQFLTGAYASFRCTGSIRVASNR